MPVISPYPEFPYLWPMIWYFIPLIWWGPLLMDHASRHATSKTQMIKIYFTRFSLLMDWGEESNTIQVSCKTDPKFQMGPVILEDKKKKKKPTKPNAILKWVFIKRKKKVRTLNWIWVSVICDMGEVTPFNIIQHKQESHLVLFQMKWKTI